MIKKLRVQFVCANMLITLLMLILLFTALAGYMHRSMVKDRIEMLLKRFELDDKKKKFGDELSKGMQQKLNLCLGLLPDPDIILLDEPMLGLDPHAIKELKNCSEEMRRAGKTMLISTHIIDSVDMLWDRTIIMQGGKIRANVTRNEIEGSGKNLEDLFFEVTEGIEKESVSEKSSAGEAAGEDK